MRDDSIRTNPSQETADLDPAEVCILPPRELGERVAWIRSEILPHAIGSQRGSDSVAWELEDAPGLASKLEALVAAERECCSGIVFEHSASRTAGRRRLEVRGIDPNASIFSSMASADPPQSLGGRIARAAGVGTLVSLVVCCVLPLALGGLFGAAVAAPFASLDQPWIIGLAFVVFAAATFAWQSRQRASTRAAADLGAPCC